MKETAKLYIVNPSLEDIIRSSNNLKSQAFIAEMDVSNFRKSMTLSGGQQLRTFLKIAQAAKKDVIFLMIDADVVEPITGPLSLQNNVQLKNSSSKCWTASMDAKDNPFLML